MDFIIDVRGTDAAEEASKNTGNSVVKEILEDYKYSLLSNQESKTKKAPNIFKSFYDEMGWGNKKTQHHKGYLDDSDMGKRNVKDILQKSVVTKQFEDLHSIPPYIETQKSLLKQRKMERDKTKGKNWFNLPATEMTEEVKHDLEVLKMRSVLDPKRFYKKNDLKVLPKYFQVGKVVDSPIDYYNNRLTRKQRKKTLVDELLADAEFNKYNKRKYREIIEERQKTHYKAWRQAKRLKKKH